MSGTVESTSQQDCNEFVACSVSSEFDFQNECVEKQPVFSELCAVDDRRTSTVYEVSSHFVTNTEEVSDTRDSFADHSACRRMVCTAADEQPDEVEGNERLFSDRESDTVVDLLVGRALVNAETGIVEYFSELSDSHDDDGNLDTDGSTASEIIPVFDTVFVVR